MRFVGGDDGRVFVVDRRVTELGTFEWGVRPATPKCIALAKTILEHIIPGDDVRVTKLYLRFMHRTVAQWKPGIPWTQTSDYLLKVVAEIEAVDLEAAKMRQQMARELPQIQAAGPQFPGASGYGANDTAPDRKR